MCTSPWNVFLHNCLDENAETEQLVSRMNDQTVAVQLLYGSECHLILGNLNCQCRLSWPVMCTSMCLKFHAGVSPAHLSSWQKPGTFPEVPVLWQRVVVCLENSFCSSMTLRTSTLLFHNWPAEERKILIVKMKSSYWLLGYIQPPLQKKFTDIYFLHNSCHRSKSNLHCVILEMLFTKLMINSLIIQPPYIKLFDILQPGDIASIHNAVYKSAFWLFKPISLHCLLIHYPTQNHLIPAATWCD